MVRCDLCGGVFLLMMSCYLIRHLWIREGGVFMKLEGKFRADRGREFRGHSINYTHMGRNSARGGHTAEVTVLSFRGNFKVRG